MVDGFDYIEKLGVQKIHEATHITKKNIEVILHKEFDALTKVQFMGFLSIIEREYRISLETLRLAYLEHHQLSRHRGEDEVFTVTQKESKKPKEIWLLIVGSILLIAIGVMIKKFAATSETEKIEINNTVIERAQEELNKTATQKELQQQPVAEPMMMKEVVFVPKNRLWIGLIELPSYKHVQAVTKKPLALSVEKDYLVVLGHGSLSIEYGNETLTFNTNKKLYFIYEDGALQQLEKEEFISYNRGKNW